MIRVVCEQSKVVCALSVLLYKTINVDILLSLMLLSSGGFLAIWGEVGCARFWMFETLSCDAIVREGRAFTQKTCVRHCLILLLFAKAAASGERLVNCPAKHCNL